MTLMATRFTPEVLLAAPRRSPGVPNPTGSKVLFTVTTYSFGEHKKTSQIKVLDLDTGETKLLVDDINCSEPTWIGEIEFLYLKSGNKGCVSLMVDDVTRVGQSAQTIHTFDGAISNLKVATLPDGTIALACSALTTPEGKLANPETEKKPYSTAKLYDSLYVRHWDAWVTPNRNALWYGALKKHHPNSGGGEAKYVLSEPGLVNALAGTPLTCPVPPFGGTGDFDVGPAGLVFVARDPALCPASYTKTDLYFVPLRNFSEAAAPSPLRVDTPGLEGYANAPVFSHDGRRVAFTRMRSKQYESDKPRLMLATLPSPSSSSGPMPAHEFFATRDGEGAWDARPESIVWSADDRTLFVTAEREARTRIFALSADPGVYHQQHQLPVLVDAGDGSVSDVRLLRGGNGGGGTKLFVTSSSLIDSSCYAVVHYSSSSSVETISSLSRQGRAFGLSRAQVSDFWFPCGSYQCHALVMRPSDFDAGKKYPLALLIHGGPQGAWLDGWSTRWNPAVFAEQGYVVVSPNPTGSTGYGVALQDAIAGDWGGRPYEDLVRCVEHVEREMPYVDVAGRAVALGASYGGYMINWIQGHPLGRKFKALVCHDGVFSTLNQWSTEELFFPIHDFQGTLWENRACYEKWDPARFVGEWATPQLIIHSELDYRLPITEGLAPFNVLQARGVPSRFLMFPDENHWVLKPENSLVWHREVLAWINKYAGVDAGGTSSSQDDEDLKAGTERLRI